MALENSEHILGLTSTKKFRSEIPVIAQTAYTIENEMYSKRWVSDTLQKPFSVKQLLDILEKHLHEKLS